MLRATRREKQSKIMPCNDATAGKILCTEFQNAHKRSVVSTPARPNIASHLAQKEKYEKRKDTHEIHFCWNGSTILLKAALTFEDDWSNNDLPVKSENCKAICSLSHDSIWITENLFRPTVLPSTQDDTIKPTSSWGQVEAAGLCFQSWCKL